MIFPTSHVRRSLRLPPKHTCWFSDRTLVCDDESVKSAELLRKLARYAKQVGAEYSSEPGKGSHLKVRLGNQKTIIPEHNKELGSGLLNQILKNLGIKEKDLL